MKSYTHLAGRVFNKAWLMNPAKANEIMVFLGPRLAGTQQDPDPEAHGPGDAKDRKPYYISAEGIAVISVYGTLVKRGGWMGSLSGLTGYDDVCAELDDALEDAGVKAILLDVDSPGGECSGCFDLVDHIYAARSIKPVWAVANDDAFSAAYAIASAAEKIYVTRTGGVGSIGVIALHCDQSGWDAKTGLKYTAIFAGDRKADGNPHAALSDPARELMQAEVDRIYDLFVSTVARNRQAKATNIRATQAGLFFGDTGISMLADELGTIEDAIEALASSITGNGAPAKQRQASALITQTNSAVKTAEPAAVAAQPTQEEKTEMKTLNLNAAAAEVDEEEDDTMAAGKKADVEDGDGQDTEDDDDEDDKKKAAAQGVTPAAAKASVDLTAADMDQIQKLCKVAGMEDKAADFILQGASVADVRKALLEARAKKQAPAAASHVPQSKLSFANLSEQAQTLAKKNGMTKEQVTAKLLENNPAAYEHYLQVEQPAMAAELMRKVRS
jgi:signal peptide peptidase SppA